MKGKRSQATTERCATLAEGCTLTLTEADIFFGNRSCLNCRLTIQKKGYKKYIAANKNRKF